MAPMDPEGNRYLRAVLDAHDEAFRALQVAREVMGDAIQSTGTAVQSMNTAVQSINTAVQAMGSAVQAMGTAGQSQDAPIAAALAANRAAIDLLEHLGRNGH